MSYGDDQCVQCGGIRAAGSSLCVDCLVRAYICATEDNYNKGKKVGELEGKVKKLTDLCERLLDHIAQNIIYESNVDEQIREYWNRV